MPNVPIVIAQLESSLSDIRHYIKHHEEEITELTTHIEEVNKRIENFKHKQVELTIAINILKGDQMYKEETSG